jgi:hypothetical protein
VNRYIVDADGLHQISIKCSDFSVLSLHFAAAEGTVPMFKLHVCQTSIGASFGLVQSAQLLRNVQLALKLGF